MAGMTAKSLSLFLCGVLLLSGCAKGTTKVPGMPPTVLPDGVTLIGARELFDAYTEDVEAADRKYKGKVLEVVGKVKMNRSLFGSRYIVLGSTGLMSTWAVDCLFTDTTNPRLDEVKKEDIARIRGKCEGLELDVILKECKLISFEQQE
ncbi:MAG: hypothetical protein V1894_01810 [Chloroflexota bacterium]